MSSDPKNASPPAHEHRGLGVRIYTYPKIIFIWPTLVISLICGLGMWVLNDELRDPKTVNAFALPGGQIFITKGLYDRLENEAQLAGVLGHEIGHVINRHAAQQMAKGQLGQILTVAVGVGASDDRGRGQQAQMVASMVNQMSQLRFSRKDESEADTFGLKFMAQAGYDPSAMLDVMKILKQASGDRHPPEFLATHPLPETRLEEIRAYLKENYPDGIPSNLTKGRTLHSRSTACLGDAATQLEPTPSGEGGPIKPRTEPLLLKVALVLETL